MSLLVVDCQYDFIDGTLGCKGAEEAVVNTTIYINNHPDSYVLYSMDWHPENHCSFSRNGGIWPDHCVQNTRGSRLHDVFYTLISHSEHRPGGINMYHKGVNPDMEEYSAFNARCEVTGRAIHQDSSKSIAICGLASEFCVRETTLAMLQAGHSVTLLTDAIGWINEVNHFENLRDLEARGARLMRSR